MNVHFMIVKRRTSLYDYSIIYSFLSQSNLTKHMLTHTSTKLFFCPYCDRQYKRHNDMTRHVRKKHSFANDTTPTKLILRVVFICSTEQFSNLVEQNRKQAQMIGFLLERNKQLQDKLNERVVNI